MNEEEKKLKPVIIFNGNYPYNGRNSFQQNLLLKALEVTTDPNELRKLAGLRTVAEVYRTLDKLALRKEYHEALARQGLSFDIIVQGIKGICETGESDDVRLKGWLALLKSLGLSEYKESVEGSGKNWEELVKEMAQKEIDSGVKLSDKVKDYEVIPPPTPEDELEEEKKEEDAGIKLYED